MAPRRKRGLGVLAGILVLAGLVFSAWLVWTRYDGPSDEEAVGERAEAHDPVSAWLTCHHFLRDSVPAVDMTASPWRAAEEGVRRIDPTTYRAAGSVPVGQDAREEARFDCLLEWRRDGWRLESLDVTVVRQAELPAESVP